MLMALLIRFFRDDWYDYAMNGLLLPSIGIVGHPPAMANGLRCRLRWRWPADAVFVCFCGSAEGKIWRQS
jgi:hypothetical protein